MENADRTITGSKQSEMIKACKHLLDLARSGRVAGFGYAVILLEEDDTFSAGTNSVWVDEPQIRDALKDTIAKLEERVTVKAGALIMQ